MTTPLLGPSPSEWPTDALTHYHDARAEAAECRRILWPSQWPNTSEDALCALEQEFSNGGFHYVGITMGPHFRMHTIREGWVADASVGRRTEAANPRASHWPQHWRCMRVIAFGSAKDIKSLEISACSRFNSCLTNHAAAALVVSLHLLQCRPPLRLRPMPAGQGSVGWLFVVQRR